MLSAGKPNMLACFGNLLEISVYKAIVWMKNLSLKEWSWEHLVLCILISTVPRLSSWWGLQHVSSFWKMGGLITALAGVRLPQKLLKLKALPRRSFVHPHWLYGQQTRSKSHFHGTTGPFAEGPQLVQREVPWGGPSNIGVVTQSFQHLVYSR